MAAGHGGSLPVVFAFLLVLLTACSSEEPGLPTFHRWGKIELVFQGPAMKGLGDPNPFTIPFDVMFTGADGSTWLVPGFYDGDGHGGLDGNIWKVRFSADTNGIWAWHTQSTEPMLNALSGRIGVIDPPENAPEFSRLGRLEYVNARYLKFREGGFWWKAGADEPENLLGSAFGAGDWDAKKRQIDYLASAGINSVYLVTHNLGGDHHDVWPWVGRTEEEAKRNPERFDVARLEKWRDLFDYIQSKGIVIQMVLEDDSAWTGYNYRLYYREMIARFGYLPALCFNFCEEYNEKHTLADALGYMELLGTLDPYAHPRAIHNVNLPRAAYLNSPAVQMTSIQTDPSKPATLNRLAVDWFEAPLALVTRPLVVSFDEARPAGDRRSWWSTFLGGAVWESLLPVEGSYSEFDSAWRQLRLARTFMESLPFDRMFPANHLVRGGKAFCLAVPGEVYAFYLPEGGQVGVQLAAGNSYRVTWFDPRAVSSDPWLPAGELRGGLQTLTAPAGGDWAVRIEKVQGEGVAPPTAASAKLFSGNGQPVNLYLATLGAGTGATLHYEIVTPPVSGSLTGEAPEVTYTPRRGFTGRDRFQWQVTGEQGVSNVATVTITCNASGVNGAPRAYHDSIHLKAGGAATLTLRYADRDGPGPYRIHITKPPKHGSVTILDNDLTYRPEAGFHGTDVLRWAVNDGEALSNEAIVRIFVRE